MSIKKVIDRLRKAEHEIDEAKIELATETVTESKERDARELRARLDRLEAQVLTLKGEAP